MHDRARLAPLLLVAFPVAILIVFTLVPTALGIVASLFVWDGASEPRFVGLRNLIDLSRDPKFAAALRNTLLFVIATVPATVLAGFVLAVLVDARWFRGREIVRACIFLPTIVSIIAVGVVWRWLLSDTGGLIPSALRWAGLSPPRFLQDGAWPMVSIMAVQVWRGTGFCFVLYLAALSGLNRSLHEAAAVDGASRLGIVRHVTWPQVAPMTAFLLVTGVIGALQVFDVVWAMVHESDTDVTRVLNLYVFYEFRESRYGYAAAIGVVIFALTIAATATQLLLLRRRAPA